MSEESRLGREAIETAYALKQMITAGVRVFFYLENRERTLDSPTDQIMLPLATYADELEREKARQRVTDAMQRKAKAGHVCGGRVFGYDNVEIVSQCRRLPCPTAPAGAPPWLGAFHRAEVLHREAVRRRDGLEPDPQA